MYVNEGVAMRMDQEHSSNPNRPRTALRSENGWSREQKIIGAEALATRFLTLN
jgi:hypothetical protein